MLKKLSILTLSLMLLTALTGCGPRKYDPEKWALPKKGDADSAMIIGRIDLPNNKKENPKGYTLYLDEVDFMNRDQFVYFGNGEKSYIMKNNYFVVPNIKPGRYHLMGFRTGDVFNTLPNNDESLFPVKAGQIVYFGSLDYIEHDRNFLEWLGKRGTYHLRKAKHPTELEMLQWLSRISEGSGWEPTIRKRIKQLGGKP